MRILNETRFMNSPEENRTSEKTKNFRLIILDGVGNFTCKHLFKAHVKSHDGYSGSTGHFYTTFEEAFSEGKSMLSDEQDRFEDEMEKYRKLMNTFQHDA